MSTAVILGLPTALVAQLDVPAGARTVQHGALADRPAAVVGDPLYRLGWSGRHDFGAVISGVLLPDGTAAVVDALMYEVVVVGPDGTVTQTIGREGEGPGEFKHPLSVTRKGSDTLVVEDDGNRRFSFYEAGELVREERYASADFGPDYSARRWSGESLMWTRWSTPAPLPEGWTHQHVLGSRPGSPAVDTLASYRVFEDSGPEMDNPFRSGGTAGTTDGAVITAWGHDPAYAQYFVDGAPPLLVRWDESAPVLTDSLWAEHEADVRGRFGARAVVRMGRRTDVPSVPLIGEVQGDSEGRVWLARWGPADSFRNGTAGPYRVFAADGSWLGWVALPFRMRVLDIGPDRILAVQTDALGVDAVVVVPLDYH